MKNNSELFNYDNIGGKIKSLAKATFVVETISFIITGIYIFAEGEQLIGDSFLIVAPLLVFLGPFIAWVSSWVLYAFGELVEKTCDNENNTKQILKKLNENTVKEKEPNKVKKSEINKNEKKDPVVNEKKDSAAKVTSIRTEKGTIICPICKDEQPSSRTACWRCGVKFKEYYNDITEENAT